MKTGIDIKVLLYYICVFQFSIPTQQLFVFFTCHLYFHLCKVHINTENTFLKYKITDSSSFVLLYLVIIQSILFIVYSCASGHIYLFEVNIFWDEKSVNPVWQNECDFEKKKKTKQKRNGNKGGGRKWKKTKEEK